MVNEPGSGIIVEYDNVEQIKDAIVRPRSNPELNRNW